MINELSDVEGLLTHVAGPSPMSKAQISNFGGGGGGGKSFMALIDTGASVSLLSPVAYNRIKNTCPLITAEDAPLIDAITPTAANGAAMAVKGVTSGDVTVGGTTVPNCFILVGAEERPPPDFIIGMNIIRHMEEQQQQEKAEKSRAGSSRHNRKSGDVTGRHCRREAVKRLRRP